MNAYVLLLRVLIILLRDGEPCKIGSKFAGKNKIHSTKVDAQSCADTSRKRLKTPFDSRNSIMKSHRIIGGNFVADAHKWPWTVLLIVQEAGIAFHCTAALITWDESLKASDILVTTAPCMIRQMPYENKPAVFRDPSQILAVAGKHDITRVEAGEQRRYAEVLEPNRDTTILSNSIVLIKLKEPFVFNDTIQPIHLAQQKEELSPNQECVTTGWGMTEGGILPVLKELKINAHTDKDCTKENESWPTEQTQDSSYYYVENEMICAGPMDGSASPCAYDEGAPLTCNWLGKWKLFGSYSFSYYQNCSSPGKPPIFAKISSQSDWIAKKAIELTSVYEMRRTPKQPRNPIPRPYKDEQCGTQSSNHRPPNVFSHTRIVGGNIAKAHSWPWQVRLETVVDFEFRLRKDCGASLIRVYEEHTASDIVVTAAHCITFDYVGVSYIYDFGRMVFYAGKHDLNKVEQGQYLRFAVDALVADGYNSVSLENDLALVKLHLLIPFGDTIQPICLPEQDEPPPLDNQKCATCGWGRNDHLTNTVPLLLHECRLEIHSDNDCLDNMLEGWSVLPSDLGGYRYIPQKEFCAGPISGAASICHGDSGGPLMCEVGGLWKLFGVISSVYNASTCYSPGKPPIFTSVSYYADWIYTSAAIMTSA